MSLTTNIRKWFWSKPSDNENWVQTIFRCMGNVFRSLLTSALLLIMFGVAIWAFFEFRGEPNLEVNFEEDLCTEEYPLLVFLTNDTNRVVWKFNFRISAYEPGHSRNLLDYKNYEWDEIVRPGHASISCWRIPVEDIDSLPDSGRNLVWVVAHANFEMKSQRDPLVKAHLNDKPEPIIIEESNKSENSHNVTDD